MARADVLMENFRTGVLDRLGFSVERLHEINPRLVVLSITGFGHDGPEGGRAGYDQIAQGEAGLMSLTGPSADEPTRVGVPIGDLLAGMYGAYGVLAAMHERSLTGRGRVVRARCSRPSSACTPSRAPAGPCPRGAARDRQPPPVDRALRAVPHRRRAGPDRLRHREAVAGAGRAARHRRRPVRLQPGPGRPARRGGRRRRGRAGRRPAEDWLARLAELGIPAGKVRTLDDVYTWDQTLSQGLLVDVDHPTAGRVQLPGPPLRFDDNPHAGARATHLPPPLLGEHNEAVAPGWTPTSDRYQ